MEKVTRGLLESLHECLVCKNYIRSRKRKVSQAERHAQQVQSKLDSTLLIPSASYGTHHSVPQRSVLTDLGPQRGTALSEDPLMDNAFPFYFPGAPIHLPVLLTSSTAEQ